MTDELVRMKADEIALAIERADNHYAWPPIIAEALEERCEGDVDLAAFLIKRHEEDHPNEA